jgi:DNA-binding HxlR family transcriptional regulator/putative sterol carrier protein
VRVSRRSYLQYCSVAHALDLVGERWALLVVRELILGAKRFRELHDDLPGISTNALSTRLKELEEGRVIRRRLLPRPASGTVYELTDYGRELEDIVVALGRWGAKTIDERGAQDAFRPGWFVIALLGSFRPDRARRLRVTYQLTLDGTVFHLRVEHGRLEHGRGPASNAELIIDTDSETLFALLRGQRSPADAVAAGSVRIDGSMETLERMIELFALQQAESVNTAP